MYVDTTTTTHTHTHRRNASYNIYIYIYVLLIICRLSIHIINFIIFQAKVEKHYVMILPSEERSGNSSIAYYGARACPPPPPPPPHTHTHTHTPPSYIRMYVCRVPVRLPVWGRGDNKIPHYLTDSSQSILLLLT